MIDILAKIEAMRIERGWSEYELSKKADIPQSTISSWYRKNQVPTLRLLDKLSKAFDVSLSVLLVQENDLVELSAQEKEVLRIFNCLSPKQRQHFVQFLKSLLEES